MSNYQRNYAELAELAKETTGEEMQWTRHVMTIATGGFALLVALLPQSAPDHASKYSLACAWLFLGLGICLGVAALYLPVLLKIRLLEEYRSTLLRCMDADEEMPEIVAKPKAAIFLRYCRYAMSVALLCSIICFVTYAIWETLI